MTTTFKCFIEFNDNKYDIEINNGSNCISFKEIYPKMQKIFEMALSHKISFDSHIFEIELPNVFNNCYHKCVVIKDINHYIFNETKIRVFPKLGLNNGFINQNNTNSNCNTNESIVSNRSSSNANFNSIETQTVHSIDTNSSEVSMSSFTSTNAEKYSNTEVFTKLRFGLKSKDYKMFTDLLEVIIGFNNNICDDITDKEWFFNIRNEMQLKGYNDTHSETYYWRNRFYELIEAYIEVLEKADNYETACKMFPFFAHFYSMIFTKNKYCDRIKLFKYKFIPQIDGQRSEVRGQRSQNCSLEFTLESNAQKIKRFHSMITLIKRHELDSQPIKWDVVSDKLATNWSANRCNVEFNEWTTFYANNFDEFTKSRVNRNASQIFDLLKIIHSIDLRHFRMMDDDFHKIKDIGKSHQMKSYTHSKHKTSYNKTNTNTKADKSPKRDIITQTIDQILEVYKTSKPSTYVPKTLPNDEYKRCVAIKSVDSYIQNVPNIQSVYYNPRDPRMKRFVNDVRTEPTNKPMFDNIEKEPPLPIINPRDPRKRAVPLQIDLLKRAEFSP